MKTNDNNYGANHTVYSISEAQHCIVARISKFFEVDIGNCKIRIKLVCCELIATCTTRGMGHA